MILFCPTFQSLMRPAYLLALPLAASLALAGCGLLPPKEPPSAENAAEKPAEMPAPDAVPAGTVTAEPLEAPQGIASEPGQGAAAQVRPSRTVLATTRPPPATPLRLREMAPMTGSEIGRAMVGHYYQHTGGRVLYLQPNGRATIAREGGDTDTQAWTITSDSRLCLIDNDLRQCQQVFRVGDDLLLAAEDGNQRRYRRLPAAPDWL